MARLKRVPLPSGRATWDACAGAYGDRKIIVGTRPSPTPDVMCHEVGHAIGDAYVEIGPDHTDFARLSATAVSWQEDEERRQRWRDDDESLRREFLDYLGRHGSAGGWGR
jgi:hypothetical protein